MIPRITHEVVTDLRKEVYTYWLDDRSMCLILDEYEHMERPSKRHGWQTVSRWYRTDKRKNTMRREDVPQREDVRAEVLRKFVEMITIE